MFFHRMCSGLLSLMTAVMAGSCLGWAFIRAVTVAVLEGPHITGSDPTWLCLVGVWARGLLQSCIYTFAWGVKKWRNGFVFRADEDGWGIVRNMGNILDFGTILTTIFLFHVLKKCFMRVICGNKEGERRPGPGPGPMIHTVSSHQHLFSSYFCLWCPFWQRSAPWEFDTQPMPVHINVSNSSHCWGSIRVSRRSRTT